MLSEVQQTGGETFIPGLYSPSKYILCTAGEALTTTTSIYRASDLSISLPFTTNLNTLFRIDIRFEVILLPVILAVKPSLGL